MSSVDLVLRDDDLATVRVVRAGDRVLQEADSANDFAFLDDAHFTTISPVATKVAGVTDDLLSLDSLTAAGDSDEFAVRIGNNGVDFLVEHVSSTVDGTQTGKRLREFAKTVEGVDVRRLSVPGHRRGVEDDAVIGGARGFRDIAVKRLK